MKIWLLIFSSCGINVWTYEKKKRSRFDIFTCIFHHLRVHYEPTMWPASSWLDNSVGRALHRYRGGHEFESRSDLHFVQAWTRFHNCLGCVYLNCDDQSHLQIAVIAVVSGLTHNRGESDLALCWPYRHVYMRFAQVSKCNFFSVGVWQRMQWRD